MSSRADSGPAAEPAAGLSPLRWIEASQPTQTFVRSLLRRPAVTRAGGAGLPARSSLAPLPFLQPLVRVRSATGSSVASPRAALRSSARLRRPTPQPSPQLDRPDKVWGSRHSPAPELVEGTPPRRRPASGPEPRESAVAGDQHVSTVLGHVVDLRRGREADEMVARTQSRAASVGRTVYLPHTAGGADSPNAQGLLAHELTHVLGPRVQGSTATDEEATAVAHERVARVHGVSQALADTVPAALHPLARKTSARLPRPQATRVQPAALDPTETPHPALPPSPERALQPLPQPVSRLVPQTASRAVPEQASRPESQRTSQPRDPTMFPWRPPGHPDGPDPESQPDPVAMPPLAFAEPARSPLAIRQPGEPRAWAPAGTPAFVDTPAATADPTPAQAAVSADAAALPAAPDPVPAPSPLPAPVPPSPPVPAPSREPARAHVQTAAQAPPPAGVPASGPASLTADDLDLLYQRLSARLRDDLVREGERVGGLVDLGWR